MSIILGHRGASGYAPENTLEAFRLAMDMGADGFELDVHLSRDGELIVMHDETVDRTTDGHGQIQSFTLKELKALDASDGMTAYKGAKVPTLGRSTTLSGTPATWSTWRSRRTRSSIPASPKRC